MQTYVFENMSVFLIFFLPLPLSFWLTALESSDSSSSSSDDERYITLIFDNGTETYTGKY